SFSVLRSAVTPRVLPPTIDLVRVNSRLTMFSLLGGTLAGGGIAAGAEYLLNMAKLPGALYVLVAVTVAGAVLSMRIPKWVAVTGHLLVAALATLVTSGASAIAKASLDASLQDDLPEKSRASAFGRSESLLQLAWVLGGATGVLIYPQLWVGFTTITAVLIL